MKGPSAGRRREERGMVAVGVGIFLFLFVGILAFTIDMASLRVERARAQAAADNAALAAAWAACKSVTGGQAIDHSANIAAGEAVAAANGYPAGSTGDPATVVQDGDGYRVIIATTSDAHFAPAIGGNNILGTAVDATSRQGCSGGGAPQLPAYWASGACMDPDKAIKFDGNDYVITGDVYSGHDILWPGSRSVVYGDVHAERRLNIGGSDNHISDDDNPATASSDETGFGGALTYNETQSVHGSTTYTTLNKVSGIQTAPLSWNRADFLSGGAARTATPAGKLFLKSGDWTLSGSLPSGLYIGTGKIEVNGATSQAGGVTIVSTASSDAGGLIIKDNNNLQPFYQNLVLASFQTKGTGSCDLKAISVSGGNNQLTGILYAPNELVGIEGNNNNVLGSLIARGFYIAGNFNTVTASSGSSPPTEHIEILH